MLQRPTYRSRLLAIALMLVIALVASAAAASPAYAAAPTGAEMAALPVVQDDDDDDDDDETSVYGLISALPASGMLGSWTIGGNVYTADSDTEFEAENGPLVVGACAKVSVESSTPSVAEKIESESMSDCNGTPGDDDDDDDSDYYGRIVSMPASGLTGDWQIGVRTFTADANTLFEQNDGGFMVGKCVEVYYDESTPSVAKKIESKQDYKCNGDDDDDDDGQPDWEGKLYGAITALPSTPDLLGEWAIGDFKFMVVPSTELDDDDEDGPFAVGAMVKVEFYVDNGVNIAKEVELLYDDDDDNDDDDSRRGNIGHAWGRIVSFPAGFIGTWEIGGVQYAVNAQTRLKQNNGPFAVNARVMVKFNRMTDGSRVAWEIKTTDGNGDVDDDDDFKFVGFVEVTPPGGLVGPWVIGGETFVANGSTEFDEDDGLLVKGAYVEVEYRIVGGQRIAKEIESETPPGAGDDDRVGRIQSGGDDDQSALSAAVPSATGVWRIGGVDYTVTSSTELNNNGGPLTVGSDVMVNAFTNAQGQKVATRIAGVTFSTFVYIPVTAAR